MEEDVLTASPGMLMYDFGAPYAVSSSFDGRYTDPRVMLSLNGFEAEAGATEFYVTVTANRFYSVL